MKLSHKNRTRHDARLARRRALCDPLRLENLQRLFGRKGTEVHICKGADVDVPTRYQGTKAIVLCVPHYLPTCLPDVAKTQVSVKAYRRKSPLLVCLKDLEYPATNEIKEMFANLDKVKSTDAA